MKLYRLRSGILVEEDGVQHLLKGKEWDSLINADDLHRTVQGEKAALPPTGDGPMLLRTELLAPVQSQELWAAGVTYNRSKVGRQEESKDAGGGDFYARVYEAARPELFFKATAHRIVGSGGQVRIRKDSAWNVPEPELTLVVNARGAIVGYTIGNDMSSRSIEGENPLYLPQAKIYDGCAALGPCVYVSGDELPKATKIEMIITREGKCAFEGSVELSQLRRSGNELVSFLYRECTFPHGSLLMTGTGIVPARDFTLRSGDSIRITINPIGTLTNTVE